MLAGEIRAEFERRPLLVLCLGLILGLSAGRNPLNLLLAPLAFLAVTQFSLRATFVGAFALGSVLGPGPTTPVLDKNLFVDSDATVASLPSIAPDYQWCHVECQGNRFAMVYKGNLALYPGQIVHIVGVAQPPAEGSENLYYSENLLGKMTVEADHLEVKEEGPLLQRIGNAWRASFLNFNLQHLDRETAAAVSALCFNVSGLLSDDSVSEIKNTGTMHIIAASGLQVIILAQAVFGLLWLLPIPRWVQIGLVAVALMFYAIGTGLHPPVVRASIMWFAATTAFLWRREPDWPSALALAAIIYLLWKPAGIYEMGFQFSSLAVLFISLFGKKGGSKPRLVEQIKYKVASGIRMAVVAFLVMTPLMAYSFGYISLVSLPANLLVVVAVAPVVILSMLAFPLGALFSPAADALLWPVQFFTRYIYSVLHTFGNGSGTVQVPPFSGYWLLLFYAAALMIWRPYVRQP